MINPDTPRREILDHFDSVCFWTLVLSVEDIRLRKVLRKERGDNSSKSEDDLRGGESGATCWLCWLPAALSPVLSPVEVRAMLRCRNSDIGDDDNTMIRRLVYGSLGAASTSLPLLCICSNVTSHESK